MEKDWPNAHPLLRETLTAFSEYTAAMGWNDPVVTDLFRSVQGQTRIYLGYYQRLQAALVPGRHAGMVEEEGGGWRLATEREMAKARSLAGKSTIQLLALASTQFTWHWCRCAADIRTVIHPSRYGGFTPAQLGLMRAWFLTRLQPGTIPAPEFMIHDVTAPHAHLAFRDPEWKRRYVSTMPSV